MLSKAVIGTVVFFQMLFAQKRATLRGPESMDRESNYHAMQLPPIHGDQPPLISDRLLRLDSHLYMSNSCLMN